MTVNFRGYVFNDAGTAVSGASVKLLETGTTTQEGSTVTTDSNGLWYFAEADQDRYDVEITSGTSVRRIRWDDEISLKEIDVRNNAAAGTPAGTFTNLTNSASNQVAIFRGANTTRADGDEIYISFELADDGGNLHEFARMTAEATDVSNTSEDGQFRFGVSVAGTITDVFTINSTTGGAAEISYEIDSFTIKGGEGEAGVLYLMADQGDDVVTCHVDSPKVIVETAERRGMFTCGYHASQAALAPKGYLTGAEWNWEVLYPRFVADIQAGTPIPSLVRGGLKEMVVKTSAYGAAAPDAGRQQADAVKAAFMAGDFAIFKGPVTDNKGGIAIPAGTTLGQTDILLEKMDYLVEGVIGATA